MPLPLRFRLGYFLGDAAQEERIGQAQTSRGVAHRIDPFSLWEQKTVETGPFREAVLVSNSRGNGPFVTDENGGWLPWG